MCRDMMRTSESVHSPVPRTSVHTGVHSSIDRLSLRSEPIGHGLLPVCLRNLPDELRPWHIYGAVDGTGLGSCVVFQDLDHQARVIRDDHACLQHAQETYLSLGLAECSG